MFEAYLGHARLLIAAPMLEECSFKHSSEVGRSSLRLSSHEETLGSPDQPYFGREELHFRKHAHEMSRRWNAEHGS